MSDRKSESAGEMKLSFNSSLAKLIAADINQRPTKPLQDWARRGMRRDEDQCIEIDGRVIDLAMMNEWKPDRISDSQNPGLFPDLEGLNDFLKTYLLKELLLPANSRTDQEKAEAIGVMETILHQGGFMWSLMTGIGSQLSKIKNKQQENIDKSHYLLTSFPGNTHSSMQFLAKPNGFVIKETGQILKLNHFDGNGDFKEIKPPAGQKCLGEATAVWEIVLVGDGAPYAELVESNFVWHLPEVNQELDTQWKVLEEESLQPNAAQREEKVGAPRQLRIQLKKKLELAQDKLTNAQKELDLELINLAKLTEGFETQGGNLENANQERKKIVNDNKKTSIEKANAVKNAVEQATTLEKEARLAAGSAGLKDLQSAVGEAAKEADKAEAAAYKEKEAAKEAETAAKNKLGVSSLTLKLIFSVLVTTLMIIILLSSELANNFLRGGGALLFLPVISVVVSLILVVFLLSSKNPQADNAFSPAPATKKVTQILRWVMGGLSVVLGVLAFSPEATSIILTPLSPFLTVITNGIQAWSLIGQIGLVASIAVALIALVMLAKYQQSRTEKAVETTTALTVAKVAAESALTTANMALNSVMQIYPFVKASKINLKKEDIKRSEEMVTKANDEVVAEKAKHALPPLAGIVTAVAEEKLPRSYSQPTIMVSPASASASGLANHGVFPSQESTTSTTTTGAKDQTLVLSH